MVSTGWISVWNTISKLSTHASSVNTYTTGRDTQTMITHGMLWIAFWYLADGVRVLPDAECIAVHTSAMPSTVSEVLSCDWNSEQNVSHAELQIQSPAPQRSRDSSKFSPTNPQEMLRVQKMRMWMRHLNASKKAFWRLRTKYSTKSLARPIAFRFLRIPER